MTGDETCMTFIDDAVRLASQQYGKRSSSLSMQSPSLFVTTLLISKKRQILRQVTFIPANKNISL
ncbi:hypothetical protein GFK18_19740 [Salmonella enterica subsp. enterica serovar Enteritidis]|nr:hypothetical protein [Salmonella enterica subsp. enterica serovar Enteritidis]